MRNQKIADLECEIEKSKSIIDELNRENEQLKMENEQISVTKAQQAEVPIEMIESLTVRCNDYEKNLEKIMKRFEQLNQEANELKKTMKYFVDERNEYEIQIEQYKISLQKMEYKYYDDLKDLNSKLDEQQQMFEDKESEYERQTEMNNNKSIQIF